MVYSGWKSILFLVSGRMTANFTCTTCNSTPSLTTVFLIPVMRFAKLNKRPVSIKPPPLPLKSALKNKSPGGLNRGVKLVYIRFRVFATQAKNCPDTCGRGLNHQLE